MKFVAIEFDNGLNNTHTMGYLRIPEQFNPVWHLGFRDYLREKYKVSGGIKIYNLNLRTNSDTIGLTVPGYTNMEDDFNLALRSNNYYPPDEDTDNIRRQWAKLDPISPDFCVKERK